MKTIIPILFSKKFVVFYIVFLSYLAVVLYVLNWAGWWDFELLKDTIFWVLFVELPSLYSVQLPHLHHLLSNLQARKCNRRLYNFPFLLGQGIWSDSENLKNTDKLRKVLKHGTLSIGFIGLAECLKALIGEHHGQSEEAQKLGLKIVTHMRKRCDAYAEKYRLNFTLLATPAEGLSGRFTNIDKAVYGKIKGVTDRDYYTNSFHVPVHYNISISDKIKKESPYHALTNAGHISYIEFDGDPTTNLQAFENIVRLMKENNMGYAAINHPVDRDPVCGYVGIIKDVCPRCGRKEGEGLSVETLHSLECVSCK